MSYFLCCRWLDVFERTMDDAGAAEKLKVFISYSLKDSAAFADELVVGLEFGGFAPFLDRHDIAAGEEWEARLGGLIEQSDTVVFVVSPEAVKSERCVWEVARTTELSKRLFPVIFKPVPENDIPEKLRRLQFVRFDGATGFARPLSELAAALRVDVQWIREHTRFGERATRWELGGRRDSQLLRGEEIDAARLWVGARKTGAPEITDVQRAFIIASEAAEEARLGRERAQLKTTARLQKRVAWLLGIVGAVTFTAVMAVGYLQWDKARQLAAQEDALAEAQANFIAELSRAQLLRGNIDSGLRLATRAARIIGSKLREGSITGSPAAATLAGAVSRSKWRFGLAHDSLVNSAAFSPDGARIVTASADGSARVWDATTVREKAILRGLNESVNFASFSPDGSRIVTASSDKTARVWDATTAREIAVLRGHDAELKSAAFSPDGSHIVTASSDKTARVWDATTAREISILRGHSWGVNSASFSPDGLRIVTAGDHIRIWDVETAKEIAKSIAFADGNVVVDDAVIYVRAAAFSPDGSRIVAGGSVWDAASGRRIAVLHRQDFVRAWPLGGFQEDTSVAFSPDGSLIITASSNKTVRVWDATTTKEIGVLDGHAWSVKSAAFSPDGMRIVTAAGNIARVWDANPQKIAVLRGHDRPVYSATFSPDGARMVTASSDKSARIWDAKSASEIAVLRGHDGPLNFASFSPDGLRIVTAAWDATARIWDAASARQIAILSVGAGSTSSGADNTSFAAFSPDGSRIVTASADGGARIWEAATARMIATLRAPRPKVSLGPETGLAASAAFSPDGSRIVTTALDETARIWDATTAREIAVLRGHNELVNFASFSPDGLRVVTASWDASVRVWDITTAREIAVLRGHSERANSAVFSPDGSRIVTTSSDGTARIWEPTTTQEIAVLRGHDGPVNYAAFSPDGSRIVTTSSDRTARVWDVTLQTMSVQHLLMEACARLSGVTKLTREEMRLAGNPDSVPEIDVCQQTGSVVTPHR